ncbi:hypothetical protein BDR07DRAFT_1467313 [Suillus spraguei]|nr:hypothetical protein BDR07DRAFT_1467313 [Suillus spraguei]
MAGIRLRLCNLGCYQGHLSKSIALRGKDYVLDAKAAFDVVSMYMYMDKDSETIYFLLLIKVCYSFSYTLWFITYFSSSSSVQINMMKQTYSSKNLLTSCQNANIHACHMEAHLGPPRS